MSKQATIHIPNPCPANWNQMAPAQNGKFCGECSKVVIDFSGKTLEEINAYLSGSTDKHICGRYEERHTISGNKWYNFLNNLENRMSKSGLKRLSLMLITVMLVLTGCHRRLQGAYAFYAQKKEKPPFHNKEQKARHI